MRRHGLLRVLSDKVTRRETLAFTLRVQKARPEPAMHGITRALNEMEAVAGSRFRWIACERARSGLH
jgi:hypothetical protein